MLLEDSEVVCGFETPGDLSEKARHMLGRLRRDGILVFTYDDGPDLIVNEELKDVAHLVGIETFVQPYRTVFITDDGLQRYGKKGGGIYAAASSQHSDDW